MSARCIEIGSRKIGESEATYIIAEIGLAHDGSLGSALAYVDLAAELGADAVKFQIHIAEFESSKYEKFRTNSFIQDQTRTQYWQRTGFTKEQWNLIAERALQKKIDFIASTFSVEAFDLLRSFSVPVWKIASGEFFNDSLIERIFKTHQPVIISTGMATDTDIEKLVDQFEKQRKELVLMQCTSNYPVLPESLGLNLISEWRKKYVCPIGLSDHSGNIYAAIGAVALGASVIEVHLVFSKHCFGPDTKSSLDPEQFKMLVEGIRFLDVVRKSPVTKSKNSEETQQNKILFTQSAIAAKKLKKGEKVSPNDVCFRKPGYGLSEKQFLMLLGKEWQSDYATGQMIDVKELND